MSAAPADHLQSGAAPNLLSTADARQPGGHVPGSKDAADVAATRSRTITGAEVAADTRIGPSDVTRLRCDEVVQAGKRHRLSAPADASPPVLYDGGSNERSDCTADRPRRQVAKEAQHGTEAQETRVATDDPTQEPASEEKDPGQRRSEGLRFHPEISTDGEVEPVLLRAARDALARIRNNHWEDWQTVGRVVSAGRNFAMRQAGCNEPFGRGYQRAFAVWETSAGLDLGGLAPADRAALCELADNAPAVEAWRAMLTERERIRANHPRTVLAKWRASRVSPAPRHPSVSPPAPTGLRAEVMRLVEENEQLRKGANADPLDPLSIITTAVEDVLFGALVQRWSTREVRRFATSLVERAKQRDRKCAATPKGKGAIRIP